MNEERQISILGSGVQPFWAAFTTAPTTQPSPSTITGSVVQNGMGDEDGFADIICHTNMQGSAAYAEMYTTLRVNNAAVPIVSLHHGYNWFTCFSSRIGCDLYTHNSKAELSITANTDQTMGVSLVLTPGRSTLSYNNSDIDITSVVQNQLAALSDGFTRLAIENIEFHIVARRVVGRTTGARAPFELRFGFYKNGVVIPVLSANRVLKTTELYRAEFRCTLAA